MVGHAVAEHMDMIQFCVKSICSSISKYYLHHMISTVQFDCGYSFHSVAFRFPKIEVVEAM